MNRRAITSILLLCGWVVACPAIGLAQVPPAPPEPEPLGLLEPFPEGDAPEPFVIPRQPLGEPTGPMLFERLELVTPPVIPSCPTCPQGCYPACARGKCCRGRDHVGEFLGCENATIPALHAAVYGFHAALDGTIGALHRRDDGCPRARPQWWQDLRCGCQCEFVNWRLNSMYLEGCMPEGYNLMPFIERVPNAELHRGTLSDTVDPGGSEPEAQLVDGDRYKPISQVSLNIAPKAGPLPPDRAAEVFSDLKPREQPPGTTRNVNAHTVYWQASLLNHQPLYFEDVNLERHGFSYGIWQPLVSGTKFFATMPALPYLVAAQPPQTTRYTLGETRPGNHACYVYEFPPLNADAALIEAGVITGLFFIIP